MGILLAIPAIITVILLFHLMFVFPIRLMMDSNGESGSVLIGLIWLAVSLFIVTLPLHL